MFVPVAPTPNKMGCDKHPPHLARDTLGGVSLVPEMHSVRKTQEPLMVLPGCHKE